MNETQIPESFIDSPELQKRFFSDEQIAERSARRAETARLRAIKKEGHERFARRQSRMRRGIAATVVGATVATHPAAQDVAQVAANTVTAAVHRLDHAFNGPDQSQENGASSLPENPSDMKTVVTLEEIPRQ